MGAGPQNYPYQELEFAKDGSPVHHEQADAVRALADQVTDVVVVSHGWNNDMDEARVLYRTLFASMDAVRQARGTDLGGRSIGVVGVLWPSKRFADAELVPGGAAGIGDADPALADDLRAMAGAFEAPGASKVLDRAAALAERLVGSPKAQREYADLLRSLVSDAVAEPADAPDELFALDGPDLMDRLQAAMLSLSLGAVPAAAGGAMGRGGALGEVGGVVGEGSGGAAGLGSGLSHAWSTGRSLLNFITYYEMKARAGRIGTASVAPILHTQVTGRATVHLVGHSFGARLVTAAADGLPGPKSVGSLSLLQAAFSHNSFAKEWAPRRPGGFRRMVDEHRVSGSTIITHTRNDKAVGIAYAIASSIADQAASGLGDADSPFGGLGSNGAQHTPEADSGQALQDVGAGYHFAAGGIHNLLADRFVSGHGDVSNTQVANAVLQNILATPPA
ncbi:MAG: hypothetical protein ACJ715_02950 [Ornithinibacter sp.]